ncbi:AcrR family transcriptional regulator [Pseudochelatococcus lubricantis]|uniref:AcrR family transcriptional regulator n=1 Tax=Pseudochelatococcus lubricantis TaxID=1538102 RepID=A0ABX0V3C5_9HYPH|nr:TetR/AcrR family transcriptional regulator [Pseudochelatococcus lubricantis]NIJ58315.1 AcrR family transcriptional regulator [Pseudochelatococcus lubricantis]
MNRPDHSAARHVPATDGRTDTESKKRRDIIDGARRVFFDKGFDGSSMDEIARAAGVSKATIYAYFDSKEELFQALVKVDRSQSAERLFEFDPGDPDVEGLLRRIGTSFMTMMVRPDHIRLVRLVMGAAEKFPRIGQAFFETGPCMGGRRLADLLADQTRHGRLRIDDCEMAAFQFFNLCQGNIVKGLMFGGDTAPAPATIDATVASAVRVFLAAYAVKAPAA